MILAPVQVIKVFADGWLIAHLRSDHPTKIVWYVTTPTGYSVLQDAERIKSLEEEYQQMLKETTE